MAEFDGVANGAYPVAWLVPLTLTGGQISAVGTQKKFNKVTKNRSTSPVPASVSGSAEKVQIADTAGNTFQVAKNTAAYDIDSGAAVEASGGGSGGGDSSKIAFESFDVGYAIRSYLQDAQGDAFLACVPGPKTIGAGEQSWDIIIGTLTSPVDVENTASNIPVIPIEITGKAFTATSGGATALELALDAITPAAGGSAVQPPALVTGDVTYLLTGKVKIKQDS